MYIYNVYVYIYIYIYISRKKGSKLFMIDLRINLVDNEKDLDVMMLMYNLIENSDNYSEM